MRAITGFLTRERNPVVPACDGVFTRHTYDFLVRFGAVKTHFRCVERIEGVLLRWTSPVLRLGQVGIIWYATRLLARSKSHRIFSFPARQRNAKIGGYGPPTAMHAWLGRRFVELKGIHINKNHYGTQLLEAAKGHTTDLVRKESEMAVPGEGKGEKRIICARSCLATGWDSSDSPTPLYVRPENIDR